MLWSKIGYFCYSLSKGDKTTTWIWNIHADAHDFDIHQNPKTVTAKIFASNISHLSLVFFWLSGMHFHGAYFSNLNSWQLNPNHCLPSAHTI